VVKVMADVCHNLWLGHFIGRFRRDEPGPDFAILEPLFQFALSLAGTKYQDRSGMAKMGNDLIVVAREMPGVLSLLRIVGRNFLVFKPANGRLAGSPKLLFHIGLYSLGFFPGLREDDDESLLMIEPKTRILFQTSAVADLIRVFH